MATKTIRIVIKEMIEDGERYYYLAKSPDLYGLTVDADNLPEIIETVPQVAEDLMEANKELSSKKPNLQLDFWDIVNYEYIYQPMKTYHLQYA
ncbi:MAG: DUF1902 domain-containing protein [Candidatus Peribacteria bacterium]|jgi:hypothetical protein|nr:DUF1902 domain-containing protein [Candidatus Peribacteria bacterium]